MTAWKISWDELNKRSPIIKTKQLDLTLSGLSSMLRDEWLSEYVYDNSIDQLVEFNKNIVSVVFAGTPDTGEVLYVVTDGSVLLYPPIYSMTHRI